MLRFLTILVGTVALVAHASEAGETGACCSNLTGECQVTTETDCIAANGAYQGDNVICTENTCPDPVGACCMTGSCLVMTETACLDSEGTYQGNATTCASNPCPPPTGACCGYIDGACTDGVSQSNCENSIFGAYQGDGTTCSETVCPQAGACCDPATAFCIIRTEHFCNLINRTFLGEGIPCEPNQCPQPPRGACCQLNGDCQPEMSESECVNQTSGGTWAGEGTTCEPENPCPQPEVGACCFGTGGCIVTEDWLCANSFGTFFGDGSACFPVPCDENGIVGWCDNLDTYADATPMYHVGGWTGWDDSEFAAGTISTAFAHSAPNSIAVSGSSDAIHPFATAYSGGVWEIRAWQYIPTGLDGVTYFVVNSYYEHGGPYFFPVEIHFDPSTGQVNDALRDGDAISTLPIVYDQWVEIRIVADFTTSLGTIHEYYNGQLLFTGDWIVGFIGQLAIMNIDLYAPHSAPVYYDDLCVEVVSETTLDPKRPLFVGTTDTSGNLPTRTTDLSGFPNVTWTDGTGGIAIEGAAGRPDGTLYLCGTDQDFFRPKLFQSPFEGPAIPLCEFGTSFTDGPSGLGYGRGKLYGFFNFKSPLGIYEINPDTCESTLLTATGNRRFFALDYNPADGLLYGYDGFGSPTGLCSINIDTQEVTWIAASIPAENSSANAMAIGNNTIYLAGTRGEEGVPMFAYDLSQGPGGTWTPMTQAYPETNAQAGAAFAPGPVPGDMNCDGKVNGADIQGFQLALIDGATYTSTHLDCIILNADTNVDGSINFADVGAFVALLLGE